MNNSKIARADLVMELEKCHAVACFLSTAIELVFDENSTFTENYPVPYGAGCCLSDLQKKLRTLIQRV